MREEDMETAIKVVIVGNGAVGKSSMIQRYCKGIFTKEYKKTIGVDFLERQIEVNNEDVRLMLWDTAGQEEFDAITKAYYRGAQACVLAFSTVDRDSFEAVESWKKKVEDEVGEIGMVIIQNKIDLIDDTVVNDEEAEDLAKRLRLRFYRTSVKENLNVDEVFRYLSEKYLDQINCEVEEPEPKISIGQGLMDSGGITNHSRDKDSSKNKNKKTGNGKASHKHRFKMRNGEDTTIKLEPSKRRTQGKKAIVTTKCVIL
ncbi:ras-related protein Rab-23-like [Pecten maximus]|uniref:ras-related protein Rab-23-like n=1 Tax=Pecten maximus TaxID=6579 RepID=UPI001458B32F|nr:ras-related protein Rab-23-like [Pecten maximus]XP_033737437.1 ras-related protein Rab-23-like [Pecten maximus]XP_033737438.1 ras-related protein Rab-23-like [Pecten maximus]XP_033737439.1 ras-related protein Rab-23-like [Pecten maximus]XP_033737440.1 ras-related protein Rab-23-like [Pecten maximus]